MIILDRYIARAVIATTLMTSAIIIGIQSFLTLVQQVSAIGNHGYTFWQASLYTLMQLPAEFYQIFPMTGFFGVMIALSRLSSTSQLIVMRTTGVSIARITWSVLKVATLMIVVVTLVGEGVGPWLEQKSDKTIQSILSPPRDNVLLHDIWLHHDNTFIYIDTLHDQHSLKDILQYDFSADGRLERLSTAKNGYWVNGEWQLENPQQTIFGDQKIQVMPRNEHGLNFAFQPILHVEMSLFSDEESLLDLYRTIQYRQSVGLGISKQVSAFWSRVFQPVTTLIMMALAVPFVFGSLRNASVSVRMVVGVLMGFVFYVMNQLFGPIALIYQLPPILAALFPSLFFLGLLMVLLVTVA